MTYMNMNDDDLGQCYMTFSLALCKENDDFSWVLMLAIRWKEGFVGTVTTAND